MRGSVVSAVLFVALGAALTATGCGRTFTAVAVQPNPLNTPADTLRQSEKISIVTGDMELDMPDAPVTNVRDKESSPVHNHHYPLVNQASFTMVSRDRLRFHVQLDHKWEEWADLKTWDVALVDDKGHEYTPETVEHARTHIITQMWGREQQTAICDSHGRDAGGDCITTVGHDEYSGWKRPMTLGTISVYRGNADFVFYQRDMMSKDVRWVKLIVKRSGHAFEFLWRFDDTVATE
jgi:hypothetical protein